MRFVWVPFWVVVLAWSAVCLVAHVTWLKRLAQPGKLAGAAHALLFAHSIVLIRCVFFSLYLLGGSIQPLAISWEALAHPHLNLVPLVSLFSTQAPSLGQLLEPTANVILFVPLGLLLPICYPCLRSARATLKVCLCIALAIEMAQLLIPARVTDINDVLLNVLGAAMGYGLYTLFTSQGRRKPNAQ